jgi:hypothetical protein
MQTGAGPDCAAPGSGGRGGNYSESGGLIAVRICPAPKLPGARSLFITPLSDSDFPGGGARLVTMPSPTSGPGARRAVGPPVTEYTRMIIEQRKGVPASLSARLCSCRHGA